MPSERLRPGWYTLAAILASSLATGAIALVVAIHVNTESDRKFCAVVDTYISAYAAKPPSTATGLEVAERLIDLRRSLRCPTVRPS